MTQEDANSHFQAQINRLRRVMKDLESAIKLQDNGTDVTPDNAGDLMDAIDTCIEELQGVIDDLNTIPDEGISDDDEDIEDEEYEDTADLRPSDADKDEAEAVND